MEGFPSFTLYGLLSLTLFALFYPPWSKITGSRSGDTDDDKRRRRAQNSIVINKIKCQSTRHEVMTALAVLILEEGAGDWPPNAQHDHEMWPSALTAYHDVYIEMAPVLPQLEPSLDNDVNLRRISAFREKYKDLLRRHVDLNEIKTVSAVRYEVGNTLH
jgi:hypothetical protein